MRKIPLILASSLFLISSCKETNKPNIILFLVDDLGWTDLSCFGSDFYQTPHIDRLASEGMRFTNAYSASPNCAPSRASILTGKYPAKLHFTNIPDAGPYEMPARHKPPDFKKFLDPEEFTLAEALKEGGYTTLHLGKWHQGALEKYWPENQGFDINIGGWRSGMPIRSADTTISNGYFAPYGNPRIENEKPGEYLTERLTDEAVQFIESRKGNQQPFFMNFWFYTVHTPLQAQKDKIEKYSLLSDTSLNHSQPVYAAMVEHLDEAIGRVMKSLKESGFDDNTIILFTSDNGGLVGYTRRYNHKITSNYPLRSGKGSMYEGGVRVPFIARWNKKIPANTTNETPIISCDIYPTILGLTKIPGNSLQNDQMDGVDMSGMLLKNQTVEREAIYWHYPHYNTNGAMPYSAIRKGNWKLIDDIEHDEILLFNLDEDIGEQNNLASMNPEKANELFEDLQNWRVQMNAQMPIPISDVGAGL